MSNQVGHAFASAPSAQLQPVAGAYETHLAVAVLCSEVAHEIAPTLAFLRDIVRSKLLGPIDESIAAEEVSRLEAVVARLRRTRRNEDSCVRLNLHKIATRAIARASGESGARGGRVRVTVDVPRDLCIVASECGCELMLLALLRNAIAAVQCAEVTLRARHEGGAWSLDVEDDGAGLAGGDSDRLFIPLETLGEGGRGTGIPIVLRIVRDHGWELVPTRRDGCTVFTVNFSASDTSIASQA